MWIAKQSFAMAWAAALALTIANAPALAVAVGQQSGLGASAESLLLVEASKQRTVRPYRAIRRAYGVNRGVGARPAGSVYVPYASGKGGWAPPHFDDQFVLDP
jgi:hypothetical protein